MKALIQFFASRSLLVNLLMLASLVAGLTAVRSMNAETMPKIDMGMVTITTAYPGAGPEDVELSVTDPIEEQLRSVKGVDTISSTSTEGISVISVTLDPDIEDKDSAVRDLREAADRAAIEFPDQVPGKPEVVEITTDEFAVIELHLSGAVPEETLRLEAERLADALVELEGVGRINKVGYRERELQVLIDPVAVQRRGLRYDEISTALRGGALRSSGGSIESFVTERQVLTVAGYDEPSDVLDVIVRSTEVGNNVRVSDVADVFYDFEEWTKQARSGGDLGIVLMVLKQAGSDTLDTAALIRDLCDETRPGLPPGVNLEVLNDTSRFTKDMLGTLVNNAVMGVILVFFVLLAFFDFRLSFWVALGLPIAVALTFVGMNLFGLDLDLMTLMALLLMLGMLVDDAIVAGESVYQHREAGLDPLRAAIDGTSAVAAPVITSIITTALAFAPILFLGGIEGKLLRAIPIVVALTLASSLIESQLMLPAHLSHGSKPSKARAWFTWVRARYDVLVARLVRRRYLTVVGYLIVFGLLGSLAFSRVPFNLFPSTDSDMFMIKLELEEGTAFERTAVKAEEIEALIRAETGDDLLSVSTEVGHHDYGISEGGTHAAWALTKVYLQPSGARERTSAQIIEPLEATFAKVEGVKLLEVVKGGSSTTAGQPIEITISGPTNDRLRVADILIEKMRANPAVHAVESSYVPGKPVLEVSLDPVLMSARGLRESDVTTAIRVAIDGSHIGDIQLGTEKVGFRMAFQDRDRASLDTLQGLVVTNQAGDSIPLSGVLSVRERPGESSIRHVDGDATVTVFGDIDRALTTVEKINGELAEFVGEARIEQQYPEVRLKFGGELEQQQAAMGELAVALGLCLGLIFMALVVLFGSLTQPVLIMIVIPFGMVASVIGLMIQGIDLSIIAMVGMLGLAGVLVNDSLVMVSGLNAARGERGELELGEICDGASLRLRPILITSITTTVGLFPTIYGSTGSTAFIVPMISTIAWGVLFGTVVTLGLLPALYAIEQDVRRGAGRVFRR
ncbi:Acriflavin resistance protein [Enhygromyxa salina]|uniref:Acriflavin resistance protein n=1 Tax=Enhygromyxa salina TaxID=215803 RepID=A0A0C2CZI7_9BACT|nr:efflux RND transporter permease subunit [Enhygromyxa salina]KIG16391.1 Acriflavin resistance protein [Enhygromyxa salina]